MGIFRKKKLSEAGKRNSSVDQARIQEAHDHMVSLGADCAADAKESIRTAEALRMDDSLDARREKLRMAARILFANGGDPYYDCPYCYVRDIFDTDVIISVGDDIYQIPYTLDGDNVTLGTPAAVDIAYIPATETDGDEIVEGALKTKSGKRQTTEAIDSEKVTGLEAARGDEGVQNLGCFVELREAAIAEDGSAQIKIIQPGWGSSGYYSPEMLKRDGPKIFTSGLKMFWNHQTAAEEAERPEGDLTDLAAELTGDAKWQQNGPKGPGLYAPIKAFEQYRAPINDLAKSIGVSIRASGMAAKGKAEGKEGPVIQSLESAKSIDFVTSPGAGGEILQLFEAARVRTTKTTTKENEMEAKNLQEANTLIAQLQANHTKLQEKLLISEARDFVAAELKNAPLPDITKTRLQGELVNAMPVKEGALDTAAFKTQITEAVKTAAAEVAAIAGSGEVKGMGKTETKEASAEETNASLVESFKALGLSENAAKLAAQGRN